MNKISYSKGVTLFSYILFNVYLIIKFTLFIVTKLKGSFFINFLLLKVPALMYLWENLLYDIKRST